MYSKLEKFDSGWVSLSLALAPDEIVVLRERLKELANGSLQHFHIRCNNFDADEGIADIEISMTGVDSPQNMTID